MPKHNLEAGLLTGGSGAGGSEGSCCFAIPKSGLRGKLYSFCGGDLVPAGNTLWYTTGTAGSIFLLVVHLCTAVALGGVGTYRAFEFEGRAPFAPCHNVTAEEIAGAALAGDPYTADEIRAIETDGYSLTYVRLSTYLVFLALSIVLHWLVLGVSQHDPIAIGRQSDEEELTQQTVWKADAKDDVEYAAAELCVWLWVPLGIGAVLVIAVGDTAAMSHRVQSTALSDMFPILTIAGATLLLSTLVVTVRKHVENMLAPYIDRKPLPRNSWVIWMCRLPDAASKGRELAQTAAGTAAPKGGLEQLLSGFRELTTERDKLDRGWSWVLGTQICLVCALVANATVSVLARHGYQISLLTGAPLDKSMALLYLVQTVPVLWALWLSFSTVIHLNTYLADIPARITQHGTDFTMAERDHFANEFNRLGVSLSLPLVGELTTSSRVQVLLGFAGMVGLALALPGQVIHVLGL